MDLEFLSSTCKFTLAAVFNVALALSAGPGTPFGSLLFKSKQSLLLL